ncbi:hypothetical protein BH10ACT6_BH10ACT6_01530 [soil metagenome]
MWEILAKIADVTGLIAFVLVALGIVSSVATRPRMKVTTMPGGSVNTMLGFSYDGGSSPARNLAMGFGTLDARGTAVSGDGSWWRRDVMLPGDSFVVWLSDPKQMTYGSPAGEHEQRIDLDMPFGAILDFSWQHPFIPWLRLHQVARWSQADRAAFKAPVVLKGWRGRRAYKKAMTPPA